MKNCKCECCPKPVEQRYTTPPILTGKWEEVQQIIGDLEGIVYNIDKPYEVKTMYTIKQNGKFVEFYVDILGEPKYYVWERTYDKMTSFDGWVLKGVEGDVNFTLNVSNLDRNNYAMELEGSGEETGEFNNMRSVLLKRLTF